MGIRFAILYFEKQLQGGEEDVNCQVLKSQNMTISDIIN
jgi:hypothetical protein